MAFFKYLVSTPQGTGNYSVTKDVWFYIDESFILFTKHLLILYMLSSNIHDPEKNIIVFIFRNLDSIGGNCLLQIVME